MFKDMAPEWRIERSPPGCEASALTTGIRQNLGRKDSDAMYGNDVFSVKMMTWERKISINEMCS